MKSVLATGLQRGPQLLPFPRPSPIQTDGCLQQPPDQESMQQDCFSSKALTEPLIIGVARLFVHKIAMVFSHTPTAREALPSLLLSSRGASAGNCPRSSCSRRGGTAAEGRIPAERTGSPLLAPPAKTPGRPAEEPPQPAPPAGRGHPHSPTPSTPSPAPPRARPPFKPRATLRAPLIGRPPARRPGAPRVAGKCSPGGGGEADYSSSQGAARAGPHVVGAQRHGGGGRGRRSARSRRPGGAGDTTPCPPLPPPARHRLPGALRTARQDEGERPRCLRASPLRLPGVCVWGERGRGSPCRRARLRPPRSTDPRSSPGGRAGDEAPFRHAVKGRGRLTANLAPFPQRGMGIDPSRRFPAPGTEPRPRSGGRAGGRGGGGGTAAGAGNRSEIEICQKRRFVGCFL